LRDRIKKRGEKKEKPFPPSQINPLAKIMKRWKKEKKGNEFPFFPPPNKYCPLNKEQERVASKKGQARGPNTPKNLTHPQIMNYLRGKGEIRHQAPNAK